MDYTQESCDSGPGKLIGKRSSHTEVGLQGVTRWTCPALSPRAPISRESLWPAKNCLTGVASVYAPAAFWPEMVGCGHLESAEILQCTGCPWKHSSFNSPSRRLLLKISCTQAGKIVWPVELFGPHHEIARSRTSQAQPCWTHLSSATGRDENTPGRQVASAQTVAGLQV